MTTTPETSPAWYRALTLRERRTPAPRRVPRTTDTATDGRRGERRLRRWRALPAFLDDSLWQQRLDADGLTEAALGALLGETDQTLAERITDSAAWAALLERAFPAGDGDGVPVPNLPEALAPFAQLIRRGQARVRREVRRLCRGSKDLPFDAGSIEGLLFAPLPEELFRLLGRTLALEVNVARLQGVLAGATPEQRFHAFLARLCRPAAIRALLLEYPVLARDLVRCIDQWVAFSVAFLRDLRADQQAIQETFGPIAGLGVLTELEAGAGDRHRNGRSVMLLRFSSGLRLVYKPRSLAVEAHFQDLLEWLNARGARPRFRPLRVLDRGEHGWVEHIAAAECASAADVARFYERQGGYLALFYALRGTDLHYENVIAAGEHPFPIDLESLLQPRIRDLAADAEQQAWQTLGESVLGAGLLPYRLLPNHGAAGADLSGLGGTEGQESPDRVPRLVNIGTDEMRVTRERMRLPAGQHRPAVNGMAADPLDHVDAILAGFRRTYRLLVAHRAALLASDGPLAGFAGDEVRVLLRPTRDYGRLLVDGAHPDLLRDALDRDCFFDQLWEEVPYRAYLSRAVAFERADLERGDVPLFTVRTDTHDLWTSDKVRIAAFFDESGMEVASDRLARLGEEDLRRQQWLIRSALATVAMVEESGRWPAYRLPQRAPRAEPARLLAAAERIGDRLAELAIRGDDDATWLGIAPADDRQFVLLPLGPDLYAGLSGVAVFLAQLGAVTGQDRHTALARAAVVSLRRQIRRPVTVDTLIGGFSGWGGVIYALAHLGMLWQQPELLAEAEALIAPLPPLIERDQQLDLLDGAAGCIAGLLALYRCTGSDHALAAAIQCGDHLIAQARPMERGIGWLVRGAARWGLTGMSHGAAGIAWALFELAAATGEERFRAAAVDAIAYERSRFLPEQGNWPDLREYALRRAGTAPECLTLWCHGAPGIGLARLLSLRHLDDAETRREIEIAVDTTLRHGFGLNHSLCHGDLGNLELLLHAGRTGNARWQAEAERMTAAILTSVERDGPRCGLPLGAESPGLMTGLAGIGYGLLRAAASDAVPSVLALESPGPRGDGTEGRQTAHRASSAIVLPAGGVGR